MVELILSCCCCSLKWLEPLINNVKDDVIFVLWNVLILSVVNRRCHSTNGGSKELSFCHNLRFLILISLTPNVVDLSNYKFCLLKSLILKYLRFAPSGCKDIRNRKFEFVADFCQIFVHWRKKSTGLGQGLTFFSSNFCFWFVPALLRYEKSSPPHTYGNSMYRKLRSCT